MRRARSLRVNLMLWLAVPVAIVLLGSAWLSWRSAWHQAVRVMERDLIASARTIAEEIRFRNGAIGVNIPPAALEIFVSDSHDEVAYAVFNPRGDLIAGFPGLVPPKRAPDAPGPQVFDTMFRTEEMHGVTLSQPVITPDGTQTAIVAVGETLKARDALIRTLWLSDFLQQAALVLAAALSIWIGITIELKPLMQLRRAVLDRPPQSVEPFDEAAVQQEVRPLVEALNAHMARLTAYLDRQQRLLDAAAHQMRTALAVLKTQVGVSRREGDKADETLGQIDAGLTAMGRMTDQLLTLGRVEHERARIDLMPVDLGLAARNVAAALAPRALDDGVDLVLEADEPCFVAANDVLLRELVTNLVDNAIRHAGTGAVATLAVRTGKDVGTLTVWDTGRGVPEAERRRLLRRFERSGRAGTGSGLGLTIVAEIAEMFGGHLDIGAGPDGRGFSVSIDLPAWQNATPPTEAGHRAASTNSVV